MAEFRVTRRSKITEESWFKTRWRPGMAWLYMGLIVYDFMLMPAIWPFALWLCKVPFVAWAPLTLQGGALVHLTFGAILGLYTWGRTQEVSRGVTPTDEMAESGYTQSTEVETASKKTVKSTTTLPGTDPKDDKPEGD